MKTCVINSDKCNEYKISMECIKPIYQGDCGIIELTLLDMNSEPLDLTYIDIIEILIYGENSKHQLLFKFPPTTHAQQINILQIGEGTSMINKGKITIKIPDDYTTDSVSGNVYASITISMFDTNCDEGLRKITFPCIIIASIKHTELNIYNSNENPI